MNDNFPDSSSGKGVALAKTIFLTSTALLVYTAVGYPALVAGLSRLRPRPVRKQEIDLPKVSVIITAYNEEAAIHEKINNTFELDYPADRLEVIVVSDCSSDRTDEIVRSHPRYGDDWGQVRLCRLPKRGGKTAAQNAAVETARGEILLFSDATSAYEPDVLRNIIPNFADPEVGCVAGRLIYVDPAQTGVGRGARSYWGYEVFIKTCESQIFSLIGVSGCLYAVRSSAYRPLVPEASSDFVIATEMVEQGLRAVFEPNAVCREETNKRAGRELSMRTRIITQTYRDLWRMRAMMNPLRSGFYAVQLISHKVLRYAVPLFLLANLGASLRLARRSKLHQFLVIGQGLIALVAAVSSLLERTGARGSKVARVLALPRYFLFSNAAPLMAIWKVLSGERYASWETAREPAAQSPAPVAETQGEDKPGQMRVLCFAPRDCRPPNTGGRQRNYFLCRELSREANVTYLSFADEPDPAPQPDVADPMITVPHQGGHTPIKLLRGLVGKWPLTILNYTTLAMMERLEKLLSEKTFDVIQVESLLLVAYLPLIRRLQPNAVLVADWHNVDSEVLQRYAEHAPNIAQKIYALITARRLAKLEKQAMSWFDAHLTVSDRDSDHIRTLNSNVPVFTIDNGADTAGFEANLRETAATATPHRIIFVGSMDYHANSDCTQWFAQNVWPMVHKERPDWVFTIVGRNPPPEVVELGQLSGVEVTGTVPDVRPYYREAVASVVPLRVGGGSRLKILESMAAQVPVVSTRLGAEGLAVQNGETILIEDEPAGLSQALLELGRDEQKRQKIVEAAHIVAVKRYDWTAVGAQLRSVHQQLLAKKAGGES